MIRLNRLNQPAFTRHRLNAEKFIDAEILVHRTEKREAVHDKSDAQTIRWVNLTASGHGTR